MPVLVCKGINTPLVSTQTRVKSSHAACLTGLGHAPHDERPEVVHAALLPWLTSVLPRAS